MNRADFGVIGLAVMGQNLALNVEGKAHTVAVYNRTAQRTREFIAQKAGDKSLIPTYSLGDFVNRLARPRKILLMVKAGAPTDAVLDQLFPLLNKGDIVMDGGNSHFNDTERRISEAEKQGILYLGVGISGGEYGALHGPSIMAGGHREGYEAVKGILERIVAQGPEGPCCAYLGPSSAGHYVKMVHNGIEYAIMETIAEAYDLLKRGLDMRPVEMAEVFGGWNRGELSSYLFEITVKILRYQDTETGEPLVERILDTAKQKGTGKWSTQSALDIGTPAPTIAMAVFARLLSSLKSERMQAEDTLPGPDPRFVDVDRDTFIKELFSAVSLTVITAYAQGFRQLQDASKERGYGLEPSEVARVWMAGCIIRAKLLVPIRQTFRERSDLPMLFLLEPFLAFLKEHHVGLRWVIAKAHDHGIPVPIMDSALDFLDGYRTGRLPANLLQAQRDFFGAHTYLRTDEEGVFHTDWEKG